MANVAYTYDWLEEEYLALWLAEEHVVEAVLGDPDPSGSARDRGNSAAGGGAAAEETDDQVLVDMMCGTLLRIEF